MRTGDRFNNLVEIMATLRSKNGCPWDKEQTHQTLRQYLLEETYEVIECLDENNLGELPKELGDLLLQVIFHAQIATEGNHFTIDDVVEQITTKLIDRHPHVFGDDVIDSVEAQEKNWERLKKREGKKSAVDGVPKILPSLARASRIQQKAAAVGFDWDDQNGVFEKLDEEIAELKSAIAEGKKDAVADEFGDVLFSFVNISRFIEVNPEDAMRRAIDKFLFRFRFMERRIKEDGKELHEATIDEMEDAWQLAKANQANLNGGPA